MKFKINMLSLCLLIVFGLGASNISAWENSYNFGAARVGTWYHGCTNNTNQQCTKAGTNFSKTLIQKDRLWTRTTVSRDGVLYKSSGTTTIAGNKWNKGPSTISASVAVGKSNLRYYDWRQ